MKLSVLVTFYNQEKYVDTALESILEQKTEFDFEILVGDDGSTDGTRERIYYWIKKIREAETKCRKICLYTMKRDENRKYNSGYRASRNRINLLKYVSGEYFMFLDGDDYLCDNTKFQKQISILEKEQNKDCIACAHNVYKESMVNNRTKRQYMSGKDVKEQKFDLITYWPKLYFHPDSIIFRSNVIHKLPLKQLRNYFNDNMITYNILQYGLIYYIPDVMAVYRQIPTGIWNGQSMDIGTIRNIMSFDLEQKINSNLKIESLVRHFHDLSYIYINRNNLDKSELAFYYRLAKKDSAKESLKWMTYYHASIAKRVFCIIQFYYRKIIVKGYKYINK